MNNHDAMTMITVMPIMIVFWGWVVWVILQWRKAGHKSALSKKIIDKFASVQELNDFLTTEGGNRLLKSLTMNGLGLRDRILSSLSRGVILTILGPALIIVSRLYANEIRYVSILGVVVLALGIGSLISTFISYHLMKKWGLLNAEDAGG